jgi:pimeloyl-ACP methyl ester carboxylesterase
VALFRSPDGVQLHYELDGIGPSVLLHLGAGCDAELWRAAGYVEHLRKEYRCILFDHRGHGPSDAPSGPDAHHIDRYVADVIALLDHLELDASAFWGYSNAIPVGLKVADEHPRRVWAMLGSGAISRPPADEAVLTDAVQRSIATLRAYGWEHMIEGFEQEETEPVPEWMKQRIRATDIDQLIGWNTARPSWHWSSWDSLPRVRTPTLFLVGALEDPDDVMADAATAMVAATRVHISGLGHINAFLHSELVLPQATAFLANHAP